MLASLRYGSLAALGIGVLAAIGAGAKTNCVLWSTGRGGAARQGYVP